MFIRVKYGITTEEIRVDDGTTVSQVLANRNLKISLGFRDNVRALQNGVELGGDTVVESGSTIVVEDRANEKAKLAA